MTDRGVADFADSAWRHRPSGRRKPPSRRHEPNFQWPSSLGPLTKRRAKTESETGGIAWSNLSASIRRTCAHACV